VLAILALLDGVLNLSQHSRANLFRLACFRLQSVPCQHHSVLLAHDLLELDLSVIRSDTNS
jgi:hypothetical protein